ncbi:hypothetical protein [Dyella sp. GSA-30]|uniref:hypothetical protein n=1 Tax=Dyella sp. GSA-30 TaxID=2994496 RepID=UPI00248FC717|nr:hypothetical protein [Dyella sp. GSA-30]
MGDIDNHGSSDPVQGNDERDSDGKEQRRHRYKDDVVHGIPRWMDSEPLGLDERVEQIGEQRKQQHATDHDHDGARLAST